MDVHIGRRIVLEAHAAHGLVIAKINVGSGNRVIEHRNGIGPRQFIAHPVGAVVPVVAIPHRAAIPDGVVGQRGQFLVARRCADARIGGIGPHPGVVGGFRGQVCHHQRGARHHHIGIARHVDPARIQDIGHHHVRDGRAHVAGRLGRLQAHQDLLAVHGAQVHRQHGRHGGVLRRAVADFRPRGAVIGGHRDIHVVAEVAATTAAIDARLEQQGFPKGLIEVHGRRDQRGCLQAHANRRGGLHQILFRPVPANATPQRAGMEAGNVVFVIALEGRVRAHIQPVALRAIHRCPVRPEGTCGDLRRRLVHRQFVEAFTREDHFWTVGGPFIVLSESPHIVHHAAHRLRQYALEGPHPGAAVHNVDRVSQGRHPGAVPHQAAVGHRRTAGGQHFAIAFGAIQQVVGHGQRIHAGRLLRTTAQRAGRLEVTLAPAGAVGRPHPIPVIGAGFRPFVVIIGFRHVKRADALRFRAGVIGITPQGIPRRAVHITPRHLHHPVIEVVARFDIRHHRQLAVAVVARVPRALAFATVVRGAHPVGV